MRCSLGGYLHEPLRRHSEANPSIDSGLPGCAMEIKALVCGDHEGSPSSVLVPQVSMNLILDWKRQKKSALECRLGTADGSFWNWCKSLLGPFPSVSKTERDQVMTHRKNFHITWETKWEPQWMRSTDDRALENLRKAFSPCHCLCCYYSEESHDPWVCS